MTEARPTPETPPTFGEMLLNVASGEVQGFVIITEDFDFKYEFIGPDETLSELPVGDIRQPLTQEEAVEMLTMADEEELSERGHSST
ncbi:MAG: hypothetical protein WDN66_05535 [Candidatus Saccharibacteria bacterium]